MIRQLTTNHRFLRKRRASGSTIAEFAAVLALGLPLMVLLLYAVVETSIYFSIKTNLDVSARSAARQLAIIYGEDPTIANNPTKSNPKIAAVFTQSFVPGFVANINQFSDPSFTGNGTGTVTVVVQYPGGSNLPSFPNPDPLNLGRNFTLYSSATFALE